MLAGKGGLVAHLNQNSVQQICIDIEKGDQKSKAVLDAMSYSIAKEIGAMAAVLKGQVDAILLTGGVAYNEPVNIETKCFSRRIRAIDCSVKRIWPKLWELHARHSTGGLRTAGWKDAPHAHFRMGNGAIRQTQSVKHWKN